MKRTISAKIHNDTIAQTSRYFDSSITQILTELLQNSRRANAKSISIFMDDNMITIHDDGDGILDPQTLLYFGKSQWQGDRALSEDAAGMGFYCLSTCGATVSSKHKTSDMGWTANFSKAAFIGEEDVTIHPVDREYGTTIQFTHDVSPDLISTEIARLVEFFPIKTTFSNMKGKTQYDQKGFMDGSVFKKTFPYGNIGVFIEDRIYYGMNNVNFYGHTLRSSFPSVQTVCQKFTARFKVDIENTMGLKFVLPARKDLVRDEFYNSLLKDIENTFYEYLATLENHNYQYSIVKDARQRGFDVVDAQPKLKKFKPKEANQEVGSYSRTYDPTEVPANSIILIPRDAHDEQHLQRAIQLNNSRPEEERVNLPSIFYSQEKYDGYKWYDDLQKVREITYKFTAVQDNGEAKEVKTKLSTDHQDVEELQELIGGKNEIQSIAISLHEKHEDANDPLLSLPLDIVISCEEYQDPDDAYYYLVHNNPTELRVSEVVLLQMESYFIASDDVDADSHQTQHEIYEKYATYSARVALLPKLEAQKHAITDAVKRHLFEFADQQTTVTIRITPLTKAGGTSPKYSDREVTVEIL